MSQFLYVTLALTLIFATSYWYSSSAHICPAPVKYKVGNVDERFGISESEAKEVLHKAESIWEETIDRELFIFDEDSDLAVNFIFDERQQLVWTEEEWRISLDEKEKRGKEMLRQVEEMNLEYEKKQDSYNKKRAEYEADLSNYNNKVAEFNEEGGAPADLYEELQEEQDELAQTMKNLIKDEEELNNLVTKINSLGKQANLKIEEYNKNVQQYNEMFGNRDIYTQGDFKRERINIYKFSDKDELARVLAHEFGHALGIKHVEDSQSIMYYLMEEQSGPLNLTDQDKQALLSSCGDGSEFSHNARRIIRNFISYF